MSPKETVLDTFQIPADNPNVKVVESGGMWGRDALYGGTPLKDYIAAGTEFILYDGVVLSELLDTEYGTSPKTNLTCAKLDKPNDKSDVSSLSPVVASKILKKESGDLPAVIVWNKVDTKAGNTATVIQLKRPYDAKNEAELAKAPF